MSSLKELPSPKRVRFAQVIAKSGKPEPLTLWVAPAKDKSFQAALKANRIMTVHQSNTGTKKDYATIGYEKKPNAIYLQFPKSLKTFENKIIIGINYDLIKGADEGGEPAAKPKPKSKPNSRKPTNAKPDNDTQTRHRLMMAFKQAARDKSKDKDQAKTKAPNPLKKKAPAKKSPAKKASSKRTPTKKATPTSATLLKAIHTALRHLESGKQVKAYEILKQATAPST